MIKMIHLTQINLIFLLSYFTQYLNFSIDLELIYQFKDLKDYINSYKKVKNNLI
jgi:hypothetical protein